MKTLFKSYKAKLPAQNQMKKFVAEGKTCIIEQEGDLFNLYTIETSTEDNTMSTENTTTETTTTSEKVEVIQNGVKRPDATSKAGAIWTLADELSKESPVSFNHLVKEAVARDMNPSTVFGEYTKWRKFYNITGTILDPEVAAEREAKKKAVEEAKAKREANKVSRVEQNGIKKPNPDTKAAALWALADEMSAAKGSPVESKDFIAEGEKRGLNKNSLISEIYNWRKFYGLVQSRELTMEQLQAKLAAAEAEVEKVKQAIQAKIEADAAAANAQQPAA